MNIRAECCFHGVGQGLFYSMNLFFANGNRCEKFSFIYDCGSESSKYYLNNEIDHYLNNNISILSKKNDSIIDLLVLSHLHNDHINGLQYLLESTTVDTIIIPYLTPKQLFLAALNSDEITPFLIDFYTDPISVFVDAGIKNILMIIDPETEYIRPENTTNNDDESENDENSNVFSRNNNRIFYDISNLINKYRKSKSSIKIFHNIKVISKQFFWQFNFNSLKFDDNLLEKFYSGIHDYESKNGYLDIMAMLKNKSLFKNLKDKYAHIFGKNINRTSILCTHGPIERKNSIIISSKINSDIFLYRNYESCKHICDTLLTGDIEINENENIYDIINHNGIFGVIQFPHHGSKSGEGNFFDICSKRFVISYGITNKYGHPSYKIIQNIMSDIRIERNELYLVNENNSYNYTIISEY